MRAIERDNRPAVGYMIASLLESTTEYDRQIFRRKRVIAENEEGLQEDPDFLQLPVPPLPEKCIDVNIVNTWGGTALHIAAVYGRKLFVKELLNCKADTGIASQWPSLPGSIPLQIAAFLKFSSIVQELVRSKTEKESETYGKALQALRGGAKVTFNPDVNAQLSNGATALLLCAQGEQWSTVKFLLDCKSDPNLAEEEDLMRPVHVAVNLEKLEIVRKLATSKANLNLAMRDGATPLHIAAAQGNLPIVRFLVKEHVNLDSEMRDGRTAIKVAADRKRGNIVDELKVSGADDEQLSAFEGAKWSLMYAETHENERDQRRDTNLMEENTKRVRCGECAACLRNILSLQRYGRPGKRRCLREKELIKLHTHHRVHFGPLEPFGVDKKIKGKYFLWLPNNIDASAVEALKQQTGEDPAERPSHDTDDDYEDPRHTNSQLIVAYHTRRKVLVRDIKVLTEKLQQMRVCIYPLHTTIQSVMHTFISACSFVGTHHAAANPCTLCTMHFHR